jgi:2-amino-4-hydroxy-6-hydroxymethyldihydropteridine diphosphokinase
MNKAFLLTGGNMGNRDENLYRSSVLIEKYCGSIEKKSSLYETAAWGKTDQPDYLNQVLVLDTVLAPEELLKHLLTIEKEMGRFRTEKYGPRIIDIDILLYNDEVINESKLNIPHPQMQNRRFALVPMDEIASNLIHPVFHKTIHELLIECTDPLTVHKKLILV